jgi:hypothetical protein
MSTSRKSISNHFPMRAASSKSSLSHGKAPSSSSAGHSFSRLPLPSASTLLPSSSLSDLKKTYIGSLLDKRNELYRQLDEVNHLIEINSGLTQGHTRGSHDQPIIVDEEGNTYDSGSEEGNTYESGSEAPAAKPAHRHGRKRSRNDEEDEEEEDEEEEEQSHKRQKLDPMNLTIGQKVKLLFNECPKNVPLKVKNITRRYNAKYGCDVVWDKIRHEVGKIGEEYLFKNGIASSSSRYTVLRRIPM